MANHFVVLRPEVQLNVEQKWFNDPRRIALVATIANDGMPYATINENLITIDDHVLQVIANHEECDPEQIVFIRIPVPDFGEDWVQVLVDHEVVKAINFVVPQGYAKYRTCIYLGKIEEPV